MKPKTLIAIVAAGLAGCGSDVSAAPGPSDRQLATRAVLVLADFPGGWTASTRAAKGRVPCAGTSAARHAASGVAESRVFDTNAKRTEAAATVYVFPRQASARRAFKQVGGLGVPRCYGRALKKAIAASGAYTVQSVKTRRLTVPRAGDATSAARVTLGVSLSGRRGTLYSDLVTVRAGRSVALELFLNMGAAFDPVLRDHLIATQAGRLPR